jgi:hypothetical protein
MTENLTLVIRKQGSGIFLNESGVWTADPLKGKIFASFVTALKYSEEHKLENVEVVCSFANARHIFALKLPGGSWQESHAG